jgi:hypothetical protein
MMIQPQSPSPINLACPYRVIGPNDLFRYAIE